MPLKLTLTRKAMILLSVVLAIQISLVIPLISIQTNMVKQLNARSEVQVIFDRINTVASIWSQLVTDQLRAYRSTHWTKGSLKKAKQQCHAEFPKIAPSLENPDNSEEAEALKKSTDLSFDLLAKLEEAKRAREWRRCRELLTEFGVHANLLTDKFNDFIDELANRFNENYQSQYQIYLKIAFVAGLSLNFCLIVATFYLFTRQIADKLAQISNNSERVAAGMVLNPVLQGDDEIAKLDQEFHKMADAVVAANLKERAVVDNALDLICTLDTKFVFVSANPAAEAILGHKPQALVGKRYLDFVIPEDREKTEARLKGLLSADNTAPFEHGVIKRNGSNADLRLSAHWSKTDRSLFCVIYDITQRRYLERLKLEFIEVITANLRAPLLSTEEILRTVSRLREDDDEATAISRIQSARTTIKPILELISDLLEMEKLDAATLKLNLNTIDISSVILESLDTVQSQANQKNIRFDVKLNDFLVDVDQTRLRQALTKLLSYAIRVSLPGSVVGVSCYCNGGTSVEVTDSGPPLSAEEQVFIFEPFKRIRTGNNDNKHEKADLGLAICKSIVEAHRGTVIAANKDSTSNICSIHIPMNDDQK